MTELILDTPISPISHQTLPRILPDEPITWEDKVSRYASCPVRNCWASGIQILAVDMENGMRIAPTNPISTSIASNCIHCIGSHPYPEEDIGLAKNDTQVIPIKVQVLYSKDSPIDVCGLLALGLFIIRRPLWGRRSDPPKPT